MQPAGVALKRKIKLSVAHTAWACGDLAPPARCLDLAQDKFGKDQLQRTISPPFLYDLDELLPS
ncbi:hypothetical protein AG1IA_08879 [Rhizoctonia solani AG-1 IA]|uniref:Uncharacterized protein n=1 Tax=Thanatephorus cucumeris (strain AG1-IA) TaxID=983506 RepID=L8WJV3_THACA|nr:hypothetical protein AG1IA_08879 [Rhizoctonia solani AG-1 IA]